MNKRLVSFATIMCLGVGIILGSTSVQAASVKESYNDKGVDTISDCKITNDVDEANSVQRYSEDKAKKVENCNGAKEKNKSKKRKNEKRNCASTEKKEVNCKVTIDTATGEVKDYKSNNKNKTDINNDGVVDVVDLVEVKKSYNTVKSDENFKKSVDMNNDGLIDLYDIAIVEKDSIYHGSDINIIELLMKGEFEEKNESKGKTDINKDGVVDLIDLVEVRKSYNTAKSDDKFNESVDMNNDGLIDLYDIVIVEKDSVYHGGDTDIIKLLMKNI